MNDSDSTGISYIPIAIKQENLMVIIFGKVDGCMKILAKKLDEWTDHSKTTLIVTTNLDDYSLVNHWWFAKFLLLNFPASYMVYVVCWVMYACMWLWLVWLSQTNQIAWLVFSRVRPELNVLTYNFKNHIVYQFSKHNSGNCGILYQMSS